MAPDWRPMRKEFFKGGISNEMFSIPIDFAAEIDDTGELHINLNILPLSRESLDLWANRMEGRRRIAPLRIFGRASSGKTLESERFILTGKRVITGEDGSSVAYQGQCTIARIETAVERTNEGYILLWQFRRFETGIALQGEVDGHTLVASGAGADREEPQRITGQIAYSVPSADFNGWAAMEAVVDHMARVLSLACGLYLHPYVDQRIGEGKDIITIYRRGAAAKPVLPAFHYVHYEEIFKTACEASPETRARFKRLDNALQWLLTPTGYGEIRHIGAMTAIESILEALYPEEKKQFAPPGRFQKMASAVRRLIDEEDWPEAMRDKVPELNRPTLRTKLESYLTDNGIDISDLPGDAIKQIVAARNSVVHTGIHPLDPATETSDLFERVLVAREITIRMLLSALEFCGQYMSNYFTNEMIWFPSHPAEG